MINYFWKLIGYGFLLLVICQWCNGIFAYHQVVNVLLSIMFIALGERKEDAS